jgi:hypothetical protein
MVCKTAIREVDIAITVCLVKLATPKPQHNEDKTDEIHTRKENIEKTRKWNKDKNTTRKTSRGET